VVFEAGFSEKYPDLIADARDWLLYTRGKVRLVILLEIQEDLSLKRAYQKTKQSKERVKNLLVKYANDKGKEHLDMGEEHFGKENSDLTPPSDTDLYNSIEDQVVSEDWVGPITAYLEFWEAGPKGPCQRGNRVRVLPDLEGDVPPISVTDLIPTSYHARMPGFDESRSAKIEVNTLRKYLLSAVQQLAFLRAMQYIRPREKK